MRIAHIITRMIIGGAQENTLLCCAELMHAYGDEVLLICGPERAPEGNLLNTFDADDIPRREITSLRRAIHP